MFDKNNTMKDFLGNEIKIGHIVKKIKVRGMFDGSEYKIGVIYPNKNGQERIDEYCGGVVPTSESWIIVGLYEIVEENIITMGYEYGIPNKLYYNAMDMFLSTQPWEILTIVGVSDEEKLYRNAK